MDIVYIGLKPLSNRNEGHTQAREVLSSLAGDGEITRLSAGRPCFADGRGDFSLSHSGLMAAAVYAAKRSEKAGGLLKTACDIERVHPAKDRSALARRFFRPLERRYIESAPNQEARRLRFYRLWTVKECFLKALGESIFAIQNVPSCVTPDLRLRHLLAGPSLRLRVSLHDLEGPLNDRYVFAAGLEAETPVRDLRAPLFLPIFKWL